MENEQKQYELTCILEPHLESADLDGFKNDLETIIANHKGKIERFMEPEKRELAYPINKQGQAIYVVSHITFESGDVTEFLKALKTNKLVLRYIITKLEIPQEPTAITEKPKTIRKSKTRKEETTDKPSFVNLPAGRHGTTEDKDEKLDLEEIDKKLDELVGL